MYSRWEKLRWELTTSQLLALAKLLSIDISDIIPVSKRKLAKRIAEHEGIVIPQERRFLNESY